jgi:excisionase family DNA binding protein
MEENLLTVQQVASQLGVTDGAIRLALSQGRLPFSEMYGRKLITHADLEAYRQRSRPNGEKRIGRPPKQQAVQGYGSGVVNA